MWLSDLLPALALLAVLPTACATPHPVHLEELRERHNAPQLVERQQACAGVTCGYGGWLCCPAGSTCLTDANNQAQCGTGGANGVWVTHTTVYSSFVPASATAACPDSQSPCGSQCCASGYWCSNAAEGKCALLGAGSSGGIFPSATRPFSSPIPTGAAGSITHTGATNSGLSGGAIAGIVIGVLLGILLLLLLCLFCCARALFDTLLSIFGIGNKRKHTHEETYIEEHHHSGAGGGGRTWYGGRPSRPSRTGSHAGGKKGLGMAAALGGLALALGMKRKHDQRHDDKSTTISGSSAYYSDYTSSSSASSSDRQTRTHHSSRR